MVWKKASSTITSILDERSLLIESELNEAKSLKEEALEELRKTLQNQKNISEESENIIKEAKETAKKIHEEALFKSSEIVKRRENQALQKIASLETEAIKNIKKITASIVIDSTKVFLESNLDKKENIKLISKSSNQIKTTILN